MTPQQIEMLRDINVRLDYLERMLKPVLQVDRYVFNKPVTGGSFGLKLGITGDKLSFFGAPVVSKQAAITTPAGGGTGSGDAIDVSARVAIGQIKTALQNIGLTA